MEAAPWMFSANDQQSGYQDGGMFVRNPARIGSISGLDFSTLPPRVIDLQGVPCSVIGPPTCIASNAAATRIVVAGAMRVEDRRLVPDRLVTWLTRGSKGMEIAAQAPVGLQPSGVALTDDGSRAYVTLRAEGKAVYLELAGHEIVKRGEWTLCRPEDSLSHLALSPDGKTALATLHDKGTVMLLDVSTTGDLTVARELALGKGPYDAHFLPDGLRALVACSGDNTLCLLRKDGGNWRVAERFPVSSCPEGLDLSADGRWIAVSCFGGANAKGARESDEIGRARVHLFLASDAGTIEARDVLAVDGIPQSAVFTPDGKYLVVGQYGFGNAVVWKLQDGHWRDTGWKIRLSGQPAALGRAGGS